MKLKIVLTAAALFTALAYGAQAQSVSIEGRNGGTATGTATYQDGIYTGQTDVTGANGGTATRTRECTAIGRNRCAGSVSATNAEGQTVSGQRGVVNGPFHARGGAVATGPDGGQIGRVHRWR